ncbi:hypothetical protein [Clostridium polynesiense]|uniref:hypothetical protein n=1 Tax=Clostridium polynesiense TaxID=1325933 RepID=UPI000B178E5D|nr:hypothetical protein [Clostridium polynesiense]
MFYNGKEKGCCNPIINHDQKIISIDGGNVIKSEGQLNALIINGNNFTYHSVDNFPKGIITEDQKGNSNTIQITWMDNAIEVLEEGDEFSFCRHLSSNHELWVKKDKIFKARDGMRCYDCTDYYVPVKKGDIVSIVERATSKTLIKKNGTIGWILNSSINFE